MQSLACHQLLPSINQTRKTRKALQEQLNQKPSALIDCPEDLAQSLSPSTPSSQFMQSEPNEISPNASNLATPQPQTDSSQHGFPLDEPDLRSSDQHDLSREERVERSLSPTCRNQAHAERRGEPVELQEQLERLSITDRVNEQSVAPKYQQIADYENAASPSPPRKNSEGPAFKIIKRKGQVTSTVQLDEFPNGMANSNGVISIFNINGLQRS